MRVRITSPSLLFYFFFCLTAHASGARAYTNVGDDESKSDFAKTHPGVKVVPGAAPEVQRTVQRVVTPSRTATAAKPASESNSLASSTAEQPRDLLVDLSDPTPTSQPAHPVSAPSMLPVDDEVAKGLLERNQSLLSQLDQQFNLNEALQQRISDLIQQLHQQVLINQNAQQQLVDLSTALNEKNSAVEVRVTWSSSIHGTDSQLLLDTATTIERGW